MQFLGFSNHEKRALRQEISKWSTVCSTFSRSGWSILRSVALAKGGISKKKPSLHLHKVPTWSNKVSPQTLQMSLVQGKIICCFLPYCMFCQLTFGSAVNRNHWWAGFCEQGDEPSGSIKKAGYSLTSCISTFQSIFCTMELS
jgi:hypothetical protein